MNNFLASLNSKTALYLVIAALLAYASVTTYLSRWGIETDRKTHINLLDKVVDLSSENRARLARVESTYVSSREAQKWRNDLLDVVHKIDLSVQRLEIKLGNIEKEILREHEDGSIQSTFPEAERYEKTGLGRDRGGGGGSG